ncbi:MAG: hypothetical protein OXU61_08560 [Gammaproteobacteria bacterium]|nr:hypothetical protein [Gammaproteobacteria bacterium]
MPAPRPLEPQPAQRYGCSHTRALGAIEPTRIRAPDINFIEIASTFKPQLSPRRCFPPPGCV